MTNLQSGKAEIMAAAAGLIKESILDSWFPVFGNSMAPLLYDGDHVLGENFVPPLKKGDIIIFRSGVDLIVHRVVAVLPNEKILAKGDNRWFYDPVLSLDQVVCLITALKIGEDTIRIDTQGWRILGQVVLPRILLLGDARRFSLSNKDRKDWRKLFRRGSLALGYLARWLLFKSFLTVSKIRKPR